MWREACQLEGGLPVGSVTKPGATPLPPPASGEGGKERMRLPLPWSVPKAADLVKAGKLRMHFLSFGHGNGFSKAVTRACNEARSTGLFKEVHRYDEVPKEVLKSGRWNGHLQKKRGYGYWFWKPALTQWLLKEKVKDGEILVYADAGCTVRKGTQMWDELVGILEQGWDILGFRLEHWEYKFTKGDIFAKFGVNFDTLGYGACRQVCATYFMMRNSERTRRFVDLWVDLVSDIKLLADGKSKAPNHKEFKDNRHDQSLWSMMLKANQPQWSLPNGTGIEWGKYDKGWTPQPLHPVFGVPNLRVRVLRDLSYPPKKNQAISATRMHH